MAAQRALAALGDCDDQARMSDRRDGWSGSGRKVLGGDVPIRVVARTAEMPSFMTFQISVAGCHDDSPRQPTIDPVDC